LPLRILEIGTSAGLNLRWDRYRYESGSEGWGDPDSPVRFTQAFEVAPPWDFEAQVVERRGCDLNPIDPTTDEGSLTLRSFIWADQVHRFHLLEASIEVARRVPATVERMDAVSFLRRELMRNVPGVATVVFHSVFLQYVPAEDREEMARIIVAARAVAPDDEPIAHLSFEPGIDRFEVCLDGELMGSAKAHGTEVRWLPRTHVFSGRSEWGRLP
jgi:hypothetical protein